MTDGDDLYSLADTPERHYMLSDFTVSLHKEAASHLNDMMDDFYAFYGETDIMIACGYRSAATQADLFNNEVGTVGQEEAEQWVAPPGYSEHQTGYAFDLDLDISDTALLSATRKTDKM